MKMSKEQGQKRLRKQPKRRRMQSASAVNIPPISLPKTAHKRRRRKKTEPVRFGLSTLKSIIFSSRWLSLGLLVVTIYALVDIYNEQRFYLNYIPVDGSVAVTPEEIAEASGLAGRHVFAADPEEAANNISELPGIISSTVTLQWPNQVFIDVSEEAPIAIWMENGAEYGLAQDGRLFPAIRSNSGLLRIESEIKPDASSRSGSGAPRKLTSSNVSSTLTNAKPETSFSFIPSDVLDGALQLRELRPTIDKLYYQPQGGLSYQDGRGWRGYFGTGHEMNQKLAVYEAIVADLIAKGIQPAYVSVSNQEKPFYMIDLYPGGEVFEAEGE
jgi:hypothetical protein